MEGERRVQVQALKSISPGASNKINTKLIILEKGRVSMEGGGGYKRCVALAADETAAVHLQLWGEECDAFQAGDIILLTNAIFSYTRNNLLLLRAGKRGKLHKVGEFTMLFVETPNLSEITWAPHPHSNTYVQQAVISPYSRLFAPPH